ncbi:hypothetical protein SAMN04515648_2344 [Phyllobacterium sp. CL33Tsu]|nr:hypothetical protein SAMN04515648_2344 [Phyllobacterium sp. CL33Tsu]
MSGLHSYDTPLCPVGHLPHKGGDRSAADRLPNQQSLGLGGFRASLPLVGRVGPKVRGGVLATAKRFVSYQEGPSRLLRSHPPRKGVGKAAPCIRKKLTDDPLTSLCPAGHLPHKGGDQPASRVCLTTAVPIGTQACGHPISPLVGEISGRTEGGEAYHLRVPAMSRPQ